MSKRMLPILLLLIYGCADKDSIIAPSVPHHYLEVSAPIISVSKPGPVKPMLSIQSADTIVTIRFLVSSDENPVVVAWALGPMSYQRVVDYNWDIWESKYVSCPCPDRKLLAELGSESQIQGVKFRSGTFTFKKSGAICVAIMASWSNAPLKHCSVML